MRTFVYFIQSTIGGPIKIGHSYWPESRLTQLQIGMPFELLLLAETPGAEADEKALHRRFVDAHVHGEWFAPVPELVELIKSLGGTVRETRLWTRDERPVAWSRRNRPRCPRRRWQALCAQLGEATVKSIHARTGIHPAQVHRALHERTIPERVFAWIGTGYGLMRPEAEQLLSGDLSVADAHEIIKARISRAA